MGDCAVEDGHGNPHPKEEEGEPPVLDVELDERAGEPREGASGQRKKAGAIRREPSFSRWCRDPSAAAPSNGPAAAATSDGEDSEEFELPLLPSAPGGGGGSSLPMDIEAGPVARSDGLPISPWLIAKVIGLIASWYTLSTCLTLYNKEMLGKHMWKFPAPFLMNTVHFTMQAVASRVIVWFQHRGLEGGATQMTWKDYGLRVVPTALATALDINLSNISLVFITVTFATMCKSAAPIFILLFAFMFSFSLLGIMLVVSFGVLLTVAKETEFNLWGFIFIMLAAVMAGFRWSMTQILLQVLTEYVLVSVTSAVTVTVAGIVKEAVTILVAVLFFNDPFTWLKGLGLAIIIFGVSLFNLYKYKRFRKGHHDEDAGTNIQSSNGTSKYVILDDDTEDQDDTG
ncbi:putative sugar phosphate/phosphate translocator [Dichanthelium oligosanthes]|uniref:Putative sugar phosphate/phosphate translocator n=1 Tax=Dichanthelium oligosanthes TaxID=888268 RepID=A0A1E5VH15_9POAL|nr:putative sugar phosphate/phosphate translocator [Dichanthelium oligosanthes]